MTTTVIIPARMASTRFPGKPLALIGGLPMVVRVATQASKSKADRIIVATDSEEIASVVRAHGFEAVMTSPDLPSGTDRCFAACQIVGINCGAIINVQGDEPFIQPDQINAVAGLVHAGADIATLVIPLEKSLAEDPNKVKAAVDHAGIALYFSRSPIPHDRSGQANYLKHVGIYGFQFRALERATALPPSFLEKTESLEQLRWLENGMKIHTAVTGHESPAVDTPADLKKIEEMLIRGILSI